MLWTPKTERGKMTNLLTTQNLCVDFTSRGEKIEAVKNLNFCLGHNQALGIVGESGSGKSQTVLSIMGLLESNGKATGSVVFDNKEILGLEKKELNKIRGRKIGMVFQDPMSSLNPYISIGAQMAGVLLNHTNLNKSEIKESCIEMLDAVKIPNPKQRFDSYSFELSGGMRQRAMIASALLTKPKLLIADEPTTALDVTVQEQILDLVLEMKERFSMSVILITHDLGVVAQVADRIAVMYAGKIVEEGTRREIFYTPQHPYTQGLIRCVPRADRPREGELEVIPGSVPLPGTRVPGCQFADRCGFKMDECGEHEPELLPLEGSQGRVRCFLHHPVRETVQT